MVTEEVSLVIENPTEGKFLKHIDWNKEEFMELVASIMSEYQGITFTEDQMKEAKDARAKLNAMKKAISDRRIQVKNEIMQPYTVFEGEVKEVVALIDKPIECIDKQIKEYEERAKVEKRKALTDYFTEIAADLDGILTFDMIFDPRYLNATVTLAKAKSDIEAKVGKVKDDLVTIESMDEDVRFVAKNTYSKTLDMSKTMAEVTRIQELKKKEEAERLRREEEAKAAAEAAKQEAEAVTESAESVSETAENVTEVAENVTETAENVQKQEETVTEPAENATAGVTDPFAPAADTKRYKASFTVHGTRDQIMQLKEYMKSNHIDFGKVEK